MSRAIAAAKPSIESVVAADRQPTRQSRKQRHQETDRPSTSIKALAKTTASVNHRIARPPRLILIDAPFSPRLSRYICAQPEGGRAGDGERREVPQQAAQADGEQGQE